MEHQDSVTWPFYGIIAAYSIFVIGCGKQANDLAGYDKEVQRNPRNPRSYDRRGWARGVKGELDGAIRDFNEAIRLDPSDAWAFGLRGKAFFEKGDLDKAISDLSEAIRLNPNYSLAYHNRGYTYSKMGEFGKAVGDLKEAIRLEPRDPTGYNGLAWLLATCPDASVRNGTEAVEAAKKACDLDAWKTWYCIGTLGAAYAETGDFQRAIEYQKLSLSMSGLTDSDRADAEKRLALYKQGKPFHQPVKR